jgi:arsenite/tail-anchored protein-transporting ATPase
MSDGPVLHFFAGKGGAGKTTLSSAFALTLGERYPKEKILLLSNDASRSLSDLVKKKLGGKPQKLVPGKGSGGLFAAELDSSGLVAPFVKKFEPALRQALGKGAVLTEEDLKAILVQGVAGIEELLALFWIAEQLSAKEYDRVVVDAAPTSQTLRWVDAPQALRKLLGIVGGKRKDGLPPLFEELLGKLEQVVGLLRDGERAVFHLVTLAEPVAENQTRAFFAQLRERSLSVEDFVVNMVEDRTGCPACHGRRGLQAPHVRKLQGVDKAVPVQLVARREVAPRGLEGLKKLSKEWASGKETKALEFSAAEGPPALVRAPSMPPIAAPPIPPTRLIFFVGHGGVGKSSCAAAAAVTLTEKEGPVLLISTDPAHSLSDVLQSRLTDTETQVKGTKGLYARELDVVGWFNAVRKRWREKAEKAFEAAKGSEALDREVLKNLLDCAPAGMDELAALSVLTDALVQERFKRIVVDPAPSGERVRIVELPQLALSWLDALGKAVTKYRAKGLGPLADEVAAMSKHIKRFEQALSSPTEARFLVVTRGEELASSRTERLVENLKERKLPVERVLVNRVLPKSTCEKCENRRKLELMAAKAMEKKIGLPITVAPALGRHPAGLRELKAFRTAWYALSAPAQKIKAA